MSTTNNGYLFIADITGYTAYLSSSELEHAGHVLQTLMELLVEHTRPPLILDRLAGDAVISYGLQANFLSGQTFLEMIEDTYVAFRRAIELMVLNNTCRCNACANIANLDLKFFVHYGSFTLQRLDERTELLGPDVILIHRLLKNHVAQDTGIGAYTLFTDAAISRLGLQEAAQAMTPHLESYEHLGQVATWIQDMHPVWEQKKNAALIELGEGDVLLQAEAEFPLPPHLMWDVVVDPAYRALMPGVARQEISKRQNGRLAPGSVYQCYHGDSRMSQQTILEWRPFEQLITEDTTPVPRGSILVVTRLEPTAGGTQVTVLVSRFRGPWPSRLLGNLMGPRALKGVFDDYLSAMQARLAEEMAAGMYSAR